MTINRLNQGTTNQVLVKAISGQTTNLLELQDSSGSVVSSIGPTGALGGSLANGPAFFAYRSGTQSVSTGTLTKVALNAELFDTNSNFDSTTNFRFTPTVAGYYQFNATLLIFGNNGSQSNVVLRKNGSNYSDTLAVVGAGTAARITTATIAFMNGSTDYMEMFGISGAGTISFGGGAENTSFSGCFLRGA
jgi:hypothetical protein